jgi:hypothetical protein
MGGVGAEALLAGLTECCTAGFSKLLLLQLLVLLLLLLLVADYGRRVLDVWACHTHLTLQRPAAQPTFSYCTTVPS